MVEYDLLSRELSSNPGSRVTPGDSTAASTLTDSSRSSLPAGIDCSGRGKHEVKNGEQQGESESQQRNSHGRRDAER